MQTEQLESWYHATARFLTLTNAAGVVAAATFLGSTMAAGRPLKWALLPLALFFLGLCLAGVVGLGQLTFYWIHGLGPESREVAASRSWATRIGMLIEPRTDVIVLASFACLVVGGVIALILLLIA